MVCPSIARKTISFKDGVMNSLEAFVDSIDRTDIENLSHPQEVFVASVAVLMNVACMVIQGGQLPTDDIARAFHAQLKAIDPSHVIPENYMVDSDMLKASAERAEALVQQIMRDQERI